ncbi:MAG: 16S rRNA (uracil(1498)-N(3))-methyltransferase [Planctomycetes bacterium]|nr:16S rRNA (uracil(1498)-N(3))-methyltransferase [Planctomycetota bacterium]OQC22249.1 MAG: Ribosomal RNA small subunit methyltransferase E [Planctomycetes bacterium ADurb.Bin069]
MRRVRVHVPGSAWGARITLPAREAHHVRDVLRLREGALVEIIDGEGRRRRGVIAAVAAGRVEVALAEGFEEAPAPAPITVAAALVKKGLDDAIRGLVEIGVARFVPLITARTVKGLEPRTERWERIAAEAGKQSGRARRLEIVPCRLLEEFVTDAPGGTRFVADTGAGDPLGASAAAAAPPYEVIVGPEGGFTEEEHAAMLAAGCRPAGLGAYTLRTETAIAAAAAVLVQAWETKRPRA